MKKTLHIFSVFIFCLGVIMSCSKDSTKPNTNDDDDKPDNGLLYIEYTIGSGKSVRVDCRDIAFAAEPGEVFTGVVATSVSTKASFSFSFPSFSGEVGKLAPGNYPVKEYIGSSYDTVAFHFSFKAPKTSGGTDYFISTAPTSDAHRNKVTKIEKGDVESGMQVYWITGEFTLPAVNKDSETTVIKGTYYFKIFTLLTASAQLPGVKTGAVSDTASTSAKISAEVTFDGNTTVSARGICWGMSPEPVVSGDKTTNGTGTGTFTADITGLLVNEKYYARAYATNSKGTSYGNQVEFTTKANLPVVVTAAIINNFPTYASVAEINVTNSGGATVVHLGLCWATTQNPTVLNNKTDAGTTSPSHELGMRPLKPNTTYYYRAYAANKAGIAYGEQKSFKTGAFAFGSVTDADGNVYKTIKIGSKTWMAENLRVTHYRNGESIPNVSDTTWYKRTAGSWCYYNNDANNNSAYGKLYNWFAVSDTRKLAPAGWHLPTQDEINELQFYYNGTGANSQETGPDHWETPNFATNKTGFTAVGSGYRADFWGSRFLKQMAIFWSGEQYSIEVGRTFSISNGLDRGDELEYKYVGAAVRCVKD